MNLFFGKISASHNQEFNKKQIDTKRYYADKNSSWFGEIAIQDYSFIISGSEIYLWKAVKWDKDNDGDYLQFEDVYNGKLPINGNRFRALSFLTFNSNLMVLSIRQVQNKAFFKLELSKEIDHIELEKEDFYKDEKNFREVCIVSANFQAFNDKDIYLIKKNDFFELHKSDFFDEYAYENFRDNTQKHGNKKNKNNVYLKIINASIPHTFKVDELSLNSLYDAFFVDYDKDASSDDQVNVTQEKKSIETQNERALPLNQIFYGPPGTGKTYNTINKALEIIFEKTSDDEKSKAFEIKRDENDKRAQQCTYAEALKDDDRPALKSIFDYYKDEAEQIIFTTFHQSYGYEEFVEGIKALEPDHEENQTDDLVYRTMPGIFKKLTTKAQLFETQDDFRIEVNTKIWKISLEGARESVTKKYCFENDVIRIGWDDYGDLNNTVKQLNTSLKYFYTAMSEGDLVISLYDAKHIDGIGIIVGGYFYDANLGEYCHSRKVKWFVKNKKMYFYDINDKRNLVQSTIYRLWHVNKNSLMELIASENKTFSSKKNEKNYVLIIDEINRGNISKVFGDLITLIEPSKRIGEKEEIKVTLPYSGDSFGVPNNLYIIGTMNTADRSIAQIDTALRRRFEFLEMLPNYQVLCKQGIKELTHDQANSEKSNDEDLSADNINVRLLLKAINERIEYIYDREHQIGHSYFMPLKASPTKEKLDEIFRVNIIPLLAEYFYGDWADIKVILNDIKDDFITVKEESNLSFEMMSSKRKKNRIYNVNSKEFSIEAYINIYKSKS